METVGRWWACLPPSALEEAKRTATSMGGSQQQEALAETFQGEFGDRRQELVFIGQGMDEPGILASLEACLLTDAELDVYRQKAQELERQGEF
eukprot:CAMPEP_0180511024 /NCGR_PEP_ID=MMETSP1036_2-20121128/50751_1 /TAXON_ID=632150 /ORGANISM="Azadinium spinosum, Strain 3D9" /LENGTH=92 /DNA_ID=CAMNT_0022521903 /DNA_START=87 /DNA_END=362 /DNA_ORIENTATION=-